MNDRYDIVVIGAGPGGLMAGLEATREGCSVLMVEKDDNVGEPVNCAEGVTTRSFLEAITPRPEWILTRPKTGLIVSPSGVKLRLADIDGGMVLDRLRMEQDLAREFTDVGGTLITGCRASCLSEEGGQFTQVELIDSSGDRKKVGASVFIAADGVESCIARGAGIDNGLELSETDSFLQYRLRGIDIDPDVIEVHLGSETAPRSYAWVFPRSDREANVGLGALCDGSAEKSVQEYLDLFVKRRFGGGEIVGRSCGAAPRYTGNDKLATKNLLVVGDAARLLDSLTNGGIVYAMLSGTAAGKAAAGRVNGRYGSTEEMYQVYPEGFLRSKHEMMTRQLEMKKFISRLSDPELDELGLALSEYLGDSPCGELNPVKLFFGVVTRKPRLLKLARHLI